MKFSPTAKMPLHASQFRARPFSILGNSLCDSLILIKYQHGLVSAISLYRFGSFEDELFFPTGRPTNSSKRSRHLKADVQKLAEITGRNQSRVKLSGYFRFS